MKNHHLFISENGGAIFIPKDYFDLDVEYQKEIDNYYVIELGMPSEKLRKAVKKMKSQSFEIT